MIDNMEFSMKDAICRISRLDSLNANVLKEYTTRKFMLINISFVLFIIHYFPTPQVIVPLSLTRVMSFRTRREELNPVSLILISF